MSVKAEKARSSGLTLPDDPYALNWYGAREKQVFSAVGGQVAYEKLYGPFSEWHHWRIGGFGSIIRYDDGKFVFSLNGEVPSLTETALASAFQCLLQTLIALENVVLIGISSELSDLRQRYISSSPAA